MLISDEIHRVYQPSPSRLRLFLCSIQRLSRYEAPEQVEQAYLEMVRHYP